jgi:hypothetical protein
MGAKGEVMLSTTFGVSVKVRRFRRSHSDGTESVRSFGGERNLRLVCRDVDSSCSEGREEGL